MLRTANPGSSSCGGAGDWDRQEVHEHQAGGKHEDNVDEESPSRTDEEQEGDEIESIDHDKCRFASKASPLTIKDQIMAMFIRPIFSQTVAEKLVEDQGIDFPEEKRLPL